MSTTERPISVFLGIPVYRKAHPMFKASFDAMMERKRFNYSYTFYQGDSLIDRARASLLALFLKSNCDYFLQIDDDISFDPEEMERMIATAVEAKKDCMCGPYTYKRKDDDPKPVLRLIAGETIEEPYKLLRVLYAGTGCLLVSRKACLDVCEAHPDLKFWGNPDMFGGEETECWAVFQPTPVVQPCWGLDGEGNPKREYLSEDYSFCHKLNELGYKIYCDLRVKLTHWKGDEPFKLKVHENGEGSKQEEDAKEV